MPPGNDGPVARRKSYSARSRPGADPLPVNKIVAGYGFAHWAYQRMDTKKQERTKRGQLEWKMLDESLRLVTQVKPPPEWEMRSANRSSKT